MSSVPIGEIGSLGPARVMVRRLWGIFCDSFSLALPHHFKAHLSVKFWLVRFQTPIPMKSGVFLHFI
jgi:hypothetical protein